MPAAGFGGEFEQRVAAGRVAVVGQRQLLPWPAAASGVTASCGRFSARIPPFWRRPAGAAAVVDGALFRRPAAHHGEVGLVQSLRGEFGRQRACRPASSVNHQHAGGADRGVKIGVTRWPIWSRSSCTRKTRFVPVERRGGIQQAGRFCRSPPAAHRGSRATVARGRRAVGWVAGVIVGGHRDSAACWIQIVHHYANRKYLTISRGGKGFAGDCKLRQISAGFRQFSPPSRQARHPVVPAPASATKWLVSMQAVAAAADGSGQRTPPWRGRHPVADGARPSGQPARGRVPAPTLPSLPFAVVVLVDPGRARVRVPGGKQVVPCVAAHRRCSASASTPRPWAPVRHDARAHSKRVAIAGCRRAGWGWKRRFLHRFFGSRAARPVGDSRTMLHAPKGATTCHIFALAVFLESPRSRRRGGQSSGEYHAADNETGRARDRPAPSSAQHRAFAQARNRPQSLDGSSSAIADRAGTSARRRRRHRNLAPMRAATSDTASLLRNVPGVQPAGAGGVSSLPVISGLAGDRVRTKLDGMDLIASCPNHMNRRFPMSTGRDQIAQGSMPAFRRSAPAATASPAPSSRRRKEPVFAAGRQPVCRRSRCILSQQRQRGRRQYLGNLRQRGTSLPAIPGPPRKPATTRLAAISRTTATGRADHALAEDEVGSTAYKTCNPHARTGAGAAGIWSRPSSAFRTCPTRTIRTSAWTLTGNEQLRSTCATSANYDWVRWRRVPQREGRAQDGFRRRQAFLVRHRIELGQQRRRLLAAQRHLRRRHADGYRSWNTGLSLKIPTSRWGRSICCASAANTSTTG